MHTKEQHISKKLQHTVFEKPANLVSFPKFSVQEVLTNFLSTV